jgi:DNA primase
VISKTTISEVNNRLDAVAIVGDYVRLENKSGRWWGRCPFHGGGQEKTPSFKVDPDLKMYHCFGCQKGGSVISFVMEMENLTFPEAIKNLAQKIGVEIQYDNNSPNTENEHDNSLKEQLYELYSRTTVTFQHFLREKPEGANALKYIMDRGISSEMIEKFKLGFSPVNRDFLFNFLKKKGYSDEFLAKSGLFSANYKTMSLFSGRLMFPITDRLGKIVAFGGRSLPGTLQNDGKEPIKYINTPETEIYKKRQTLFGIDLAKSEIRQTKTVYLVEGYIDVIALHQAGITNTVAPLGTAFTDEQAQWIRRWVDKVILNFDNDEAGHKAAYNTIIICQKNGMSNSLIDIQNGLKNEIDGQETEFIKDPSEILHKFGEKILKNILKFIINDFEYLISRGKSQYVTVRGDINGAVRFMFPYVDSLNTEINRSDCISRIADIYKIEREAVQKDYSEWKKRTGNFSRKTEGKKNEQGLEDQDSHFRHKLTRNAELSLLTIVAVNMDLYRDFRAAVEIKEIEDRAAKEIFITLEECFVHDESGIDSILSRIKDEDLRNFVADRGTTGEYRGSSARQLMEDGILGIRIRRYEKRLIEINAQMREIERKNESLDLIDELLEEKKLIDSQIRTLKNKK